MEDAKRAKTIKAATATLTIITRRMMATMAINTRRMMGIAKIATTMTIGMDIRTKK